MIEQERNQLTDAAIDLLLSKDGDRDHMNHYLRAIYGDCRVAALLAPIWREPR